MDTNKFRLLAKVVELGNITKAASMLGYTQSGASHQLSSIEEELGIKILQRDRSGTKLTAEGMILMPYIREAISSEDKIMAVINSITGMQIGTLKVGAFTSISLAWLPFIIGQFHQLYPQVSIEIVSGNGSYPEMEQFLYDGLVDCSFVCEPVSSNLNYIKLFEDPLYLVLPPTHPLAASTAPIRFEQLTDVPFLMPTDGNNTDIINLCHTFGFSPSVAFTMHDDLALLAMTENNLGCTILPGLILNHYSHHAIVKALEGHPTRTICIATRFDKIESPIVATFLNLTQQIVFNKSIPSANGTT